MDAPSPYAFDKYEKPAPLPLPLPPAQPPPPPEPPACFPPALSLATEVTPPVSSETTEVVGYGVARGSHVGREVLAASVADATVMAHGGANGAGWSRGASVAQPPLQTFSNEKTVVRATVATEELYPGDGGGGSQQGYAPAAATPEPEELEDEAARELRLAMEEETRYYQESDVRAPAVVESEDGDERNHERFLDGPEMSATAMGGNPEGHTLPEQAELQPAESAGGAVEGRESGEGEGDDGELARVLEEARLEQEHARLGRGREEEEEEMLARVMEESRLEQERRDEEQMEFRRVRKPAKTWLAACCFYGI